MRAAHTKKKNTSNKNFLLFGGGALGPRRWLGHGTTGAAMDNCGGTVVGETVEDARVAGHADPILVIEAMKQFRFPQLRLELFHKHLGEEISNALSKECNGKRQVQSRRQHSIQWELPNHASTRLDRETNHKRQQPHETRYLLWTRRPHDVGLRIVVFANQSAAGCLDAPLKACLPAALVELPLAVGGDEERSGRNNWS